MPDALPDDAVHDDPPPVSESLDRLNTIFEDFEEALKDQGLCVEAWLQVPHPTDAWSLGFKKMGKHWRLRVRRGDQLDTLREVSAEIRIKAAHMLGDLVEALESRIDNREMAAQLSVSAALCALQELKGETGD